jgi:hypothetical protein
MLSKEEEERERARARIHFEEMKSLSEKEGEKGCIAILCILGIIAVFLFFWKFGI